MDYPRGVLRNEAQSNVLVCSNNKTDDVRVT